MLALIKKLFFTIFFVCIYANFLSAQITQIKGFVDALSSVEKGKVSFGFGEQDLFITSELSDRLSFLGESVFKYTPSSPTEFSISIERIVIKYNFYENHNLLVGKHHTPINYWNDTYHHGRVFFPTIERPLLFDANIIPLHTTGVSVQGHDLGAIKFGYDVMVGNGIGSEEISDNDKSKSITAALHIKPVQNLRIGFSFYNDALSKGATTHDNRTINWRVKQNLYTGSVAYFGKKFEFLGESTLANNHTDTTGNKQTLASYVYAGYKIAEKFIPYIRFDDIHYQAGEIYYRKNNMTSIVAGFRYQINYLSVVKLEYQHQHSELAADGNKVTAQFAIGF